jgi:hypothetical protein
MSAFTRIRVEDVNRVTELAANHAIEHNVMPFSGPYDDWVTFKFTTPHGKVAFDRVCAENNVTIQDTMVVSRMLDAMVEDSKTAADVLEKATITPGMSKVYGRGRVKYRCVNAGCGLAIPVYPGSYSKSCPNCGGELGSP